jgi:flavin-dependent dehydrogenase
MAITSDVLVAGGGLAGITTALSAADPGESISVTADAPSGTDITVYLYDSEQRIVTAREGTGTSTFEFSITADDVEGDVVSGTYAFVLQHDGTRKAAHPLVIRGYSVDVSAPDTAPQGETITVSAEIDKLRGQDMEDVEVVMANDATTIGKSATASGAGTYTAEIDTSDLSAGSYDVYANVRGPDSALGEKELLVGLRDQNHRRISHSKPLH